MIEFTIGLTKQEYDTMRSEFKNGTYLPDYKDRFVITNEYSQVGSDAVMLDIKATDGNAIWAVASWVELCHQQRKQIFGENYKIDPDWNDPKYN